MSLIATENYKFRNQITNSVWYISPAIDGFQKKTSPTKNPVVLPSLPKVWSLSQLFFEVSSNPKGKAEKILLLRELEFDKDF